jgi:hypothetical protein
VRLGSWPDVGAMIAAPDLTATTDVVVVERRGKKKEEIKNYNMTCGSYIFGKIIGDMLKHVHQ